MKTQKYLRQRRTQARNVKDKGVGDILKEDICARDFFVAISDLARHGRSTDLELLQSR